MKTFREFLNEQILFTGYVKDGRIFVNVNVERKTIVVDAIHHNRIKKLEQEDPEKAYDLLIKLINSGDAFVL